MHSQHAGPSQADLIRERARLDYVESAANRGQATFTILTGDVVRSMGLQDRVPAVCSALKSKIFLKQNDLDIEAIEGPPSGNGTRVRYHYRRRTAPTSRSDAFAEIRGIFSGIPSFSESIESDRRSFERP